MRIGKITKKYMAIWLMIRFRYKTLHMCNDRIQFKTIMNNPTNKQKIHGKLTMKLIKEIVISSQHYSCAIYQINFVKEWDNFRKRLF